MNLRSNFPATTLNKKLLLLEVIPSFTVTLMVEAPVMFAAGVRWILLSGPSPEKVILPFVKGPYSTRSQKASACRRHPHQSV